MTMADSNFYSATKLYQFLAAGVATLGAFGLGTVLSWPSPGIPSLKEDPEWNQTVTGITEQFVGSIVPLGALTSCFVAGSLIGVVGRKTTMLLMSLPFVLGWLLIVFASNVPMLLAGRFITGFCGGAFSLAAPVYIGEIAETSVRGSLGAAFQLMVNFGILFSYVAGSFVNYIWLSVMCGVVPIVFAVLMFFVPESPKFYLTKGKSSSASTALAWLRGTRSPSDVQAEIQSMQKSIDKANQEKSSFSDLFKPSILKPTSICILLMVFQQLSGINAVVFYTKTIFKSAGADINPDLASIIVGTVMLVATFGATLFIDKAGRKILLLISDLCMGVSLVALGVFFLLKETDPKTAANIGWLPLLSMIVFVIAFSIGFGPIPWMMMGEILPPKVIGLAGSIATLSNWGLAFLVTLSFAPLQDAIGIHWCYWVFAIVCFVGFVYVLMFVPETKGKSIDEIQALFGGNNLVTYNGTYDAEGRQNTGYEQ